MSDDEFMSRLRWGLGMLDSAAKKSDRWWFVTLLVIGLFVAGFLIYDFRKQIAARDVRIEALHDSIENKFAATLSENTRALDRNSAVMEARVLRAGN